MSKLSRITRDELYYSSEDSGAFSAIADVYQAFAHLPIYFRRAYQDLKEKYARSLLGPLWETAGTIAFVFGFAIIGSRIFGAQRTQYVAYLTAGIVYWQFIVANINTATTAFIGNMSEIRVKRVSYVGIVISLTIRNFLAMLHSLPLIVLVSYFTGNYSWYMLYIIPNMFLVILFFLPASLFCALISSRYRDVKYALSMIMQFMFYFTPIFWQEDIIKDYPARFMIELNPFYHLIAILRAPSLGQAPPYMSMYIVMGMTAAMLLVTSIAFIRFRKRIVYWL